MPKPIPVTQICILRFRDEAGSFWSLREVTFEQHDGAATLTRLNLSPDGPHMSRETAHMVGEALVRWADKEEHDAPPTD